MKKIKSKRYTLYRGDCLKVMPKLKEHSISLILADLPYGTTACKWDSIIPLDKMWEQYKRLMKDDKTPIVLFANIQFALELIMSNRSWFKYEWIWEKSKSGSAFTAKFCPNKVHEYILVFCKSSSNYYPQMTKGEPFTRTLLSRKGKNDHKYGLKSGVGIVNEGTRYPRSVQKFIQHFSRNSQGHPTQKPVELMEYLVKTYSKKNQIVLDNTMGSGTTGVACINTGRKFIGIEKDKEYFKMARERIKATIPPLAMS